MCNVVRIIFDDAGFYLVDTLIVLKFNTIWIEFKLILRN